MSRLCAALALVTLVWSSPTRAGASAPAARIIDQSVVKAERARHKGRVLVVHLWATWCGACVDELPLLANLARQAKSRGIDFLPLSLDEPTARSAVHVARVLRATTGDARWSPILKVSDAEALVAELDPRWEGEVPVFFVYDRQGRLHRTVVGDLPWASLEPLVGDLTKPSLP